MKSKIGIPLLLTTVFALSCLASRADYRTWTDDEGHQIKAEFIQNMDGSVSLRTEQHKLIHVSISSLSGKDQEYILSLTPPHLNIDVQELTDTHSSAFDVGGGGDGNGENDYNILNTKSELKATLTKESMAPYKGVINAELYVIGSKSASEQFVLMNKTNANVTFGQDMSDKFSFTSGNIDFKDLQAGSTFGMQYAGYLLVLLDGSGRMFESKANHSEFSEHIAIIRSASQGSVINLPCNSAFE
ncbi:SHD1 domain-containing protein [Pontiellaceae bacterium B1224]|nr:SHD1 domain-containing protein [Pontiellaceae bacterium B1224]